MRTLRLLAALLPAAATVALASCGARTGLDVDLATDGASAPRDALADVDADGDANVPIACVDGTIALTRAQPTLMLTIDRSGSMGDPIGGPGSVSKWQALTNALGQALPSVDGSMQIGALLFPTSASRTAASCIVSGGPNLAPATGHVGQLLGIMRSNTPGGATPTADALKAAAADVLQARAGSNARAIVLATDGAPNCNASLDPNTCRCASVIQVCRTSQNCLDDTRTVDEIKSYAASGLPTYVIGIQANGDVAFTDVLNAMALAGGRPSGGAQQFYAAASEADITAALVAIRDQVGACTYLTTSVPDDRGTITVTVDGVVIPYDPTGVQGWTWGNKGNGEIRLVGAACGAVTDAGNPTLLAHVVCNVADAAAEGGEAGDADAAPRDASDAP